MIRRLLAAIRAEAAQTLTEYGLIISFLIIPLLVLAVMGFREQIVGAFEAAAAVFP